MKSQMSLMLLSFLPNLIFCPDFLLWRTMIWLNRTAYSVRFLQAVVLSFNILILRKDLIFRGQYWECLMFPHGLSYQGMS